MKTVLCDIDGVLLHNNTLVSGSDKFIKKIQQQGNPLLLLTNYPSQTAKDLKNRLESVGIELPEEAFYTSAMATIDEYRCISLPLRFLG